MITTHEEADSLIPHHANSLSLFGKCVCSVPNNTELCQFIHFYYNGSFLIQVLNKMERKAQENDAIGEAINETHSGVVPTEGSTGKAELLERKPCNKRVLDMLRKHLRNCGNISEIVKYQW